MENFSTAQQVTDFLLQRGTSFDTEYKLDRVIDLFERLNIRELSCKTIHVAGTNGKGSTSAMLEAIYRGNGYKTGLFTSPHLTSIFERTRVGNVLITEEDFVRIFKKVHAVVRQLEAEKNSYRFSFFEYETAMALAFFCEQNIDVAVIEVGLGGRLDATNAVRTTTCSVISTIAYDHENVLGYSLESIAREKAGIIKENSLTFLGNRVQGNPLKEIEGIAKCKNNELFQVPEVDIFFGEGTASYQNYNASTAFLVAKILSEKNILPLDLSKARKSIRSFFWPARWQMIQFSETTTLILDGAHNEEGATVLAQEIEKLSIKPTLILGSNSIERAQKILKILAPFADKIILSSSTNEHALSPETLASCMPPKSVPRASYIKLENLTEFIQTSREKIIVIAGSLYLIGDIMKKFEFAVNKNNT